MNLSDGLLDSIYIDTSPNPIWNIQCSIYQLYGHLWRIFPQKDNLDKEVITKKKEEQEDDKSPPSLLLHLRS